MNASPLRSEDMWRDKQQLIQEPTLLTSYLRVGLAIWEKESLGMFLT